MQRQPSHHGLLSLVLADPVAARHFLLGAANSSTGAGSKITISGSAFALLALEPSISTWPLPADVRAVAPSWVGFPRGTGMGGMEVSKSAPQGGCSVHGIPGAVTRRGPGRTKYTVVPTQDPCQGTWPTPGMAREGAWHGSPVGMGERTRPRPFAAASKDKAAQRGLYQTPRLHQPRVASSLHGNNGTIRAYFPRSSRPWRTYDGAA